MGQVCSTDGTLPEKPELDVDVDTGDAGLDKAVEDAADKAVEKAEEKAEDKAEKQAKKAVKKVEKKVEKAVEKKGDSKKEKNTDDFAGGVYPFDKVPDLWKKGDIFDKAKLEETFPGDKGSAKVRAGLWKDLDNNGNGYVSLAEFDGWFNKTTLAIEKPKGEGSDKSEIYRYARPCLIRAFNLANGVAKVNPDAKGIAASGDDYITKPEFRVLLVALQASLAVYRAFDKADTSDDQRVSKKEWAAQLDTLNSEVKSWGYSGPELTADDFDKADADGAGMVLLDEAVHFFLGLFTSDKHLLAENEEEGA